MTKPSFPPYNVGDLGHGLKRQAPAAARNVGPIGDVLAEWLPTSGLVLEIASGTGEHALAFARRFPKLDWQPTDPDPEALASIAAWQAEGPDNLKPPIQLDVCANWPAAHADAILCINMVHIAPWEASQGLLDGATRLLGTAAPLILYAPGCRPTSQPRHPTKRSISVFAIVIRAGDCAWSRISPPKPKSVDSASRNDDRCRRTI